MVFALADVQAEKDVHIAGVRAFFAAHGIHRFVRLITDNGSRVHVPATRRHRGCVQFLDVQVDRVAG